MEKDPLITAKLIYFCEKILESKRDGDQFTSVSYAPLLGMTRDEVSDLIHLLKTKKLAKWEYVIKTVQDDEGRDVEVDFDSLSFNKRGIKEYVKKLKKGLKESPTIKREELLRIREQVNSIFDKKACMRVLAKFYSTDDLYIYFHYDKYVLVDLLLSHAYSNKVSLAEVLAEFLNPVYYNIGEGGRSDQLFQFIDKVFYLFADEKDYNDWQEKVSKYVATVQNKKGVKTTNHNEIEIMGENVIFRDKTMSIKRGYKKMFIELNKTPQINRNGKPLKQGEKVHRSVLQSVAYRDEDSFRSALAKLKNKIKKSGLPIEIVNDTTNHYMLKIDY
jgi:hypothetical protein